MRALISVSDKAGLIPFAEGLIGLGFEIISTGGTFKVLQEHDIPVISIDSVTGFPEMMDGRVKTLHPKIHGGLLALRDNATHMQACKDHAIGLIDLVVVNLYPFEKTISNPNVHLEEAIENIDIGGPSMIRSASKNYRSVGVIVNPLRYQAVLDELKESSGVLSLKTKEPLCIEAFQHTAAYDAIIAQYLSQNLGSDQPVFSDRITPVLTKVSDLRYGENPHQQAAFYKLSGETGLPAFEQVHGKELSYNNLIDLEAAWQLVRDHHQPAAVIIKHTNPCGIAVAETIAEAYQKAYEADSVSAFGGIIGLNRDVDLATAELISQTFIEAVIAPGFDKRAIEILSQKPSIRLIILPHFSLVPKGLIYKYVPGGFLLQTPDSLQVTAESLVTVTQHLPSDAQIRDLLFAFSVVKHVKSNAIVVAKNGQTLGIGAGQMSRIEAVEIALKKAGSHAKGAVLASDAFFPFSDSVQLAHTAGISAIIQPGGSKKDDDSIQVCNQHGLSMVFTQIRHFKH